MTPIPALSVRQPWTELILAGRKRIEVRTWYDSYRGPLWMHAGQRADDAAIRHFGLGELFTGGVVGLVTLLDIVPLNAQRWEKWRSLHCVPGPLREHCYAWLIDEPRRLATPVPARGKLRLFRLDDEVELLSFERLAATGARTPAS